MRTHLAGLDSAVKAEMRTLILAERRQASREFSKTHVGEGGTCVGRSLFSHVTRSRSNVFSVGKRWRCQASFSVPLLAYVLFDSARTPLFS
jgi:hypothetical protein